MLYRTYVLYLAFRNLEALLCRIMITTGTVEDDTNILGREFKTPSYLTDQTLLKYGFVTSWRDLLLMEDSCYTIENICFP